MTAWRIHIPSKWQEISMKYILILQFTILLAKENCEHIECPNIFEQVCGVTTSKLNETRIISRFQNSCHMRKIQCRLQSVVEIKQIPDALCTISEEVAPESGRRVADFSILGSYQSCDHMCPTYCVDIYEPACAQIYKRGSFSSEFRPMINHCHIDLFSCSFGLNVTIHPINKCYQNPPGLLFMTQVAAMKSLKLLDVDDMPGENVNVAPKNRRSRRTNDAVDMQIDYLIRRLL